MVFTKGSRRGSYIAGGIAAVGVLLIAATVFGFYAANGPLPAVPAETVVEKFYERISQAGLRGGTLLIRDAYKLIDSERSKMSEARFVQVIQQYPTGFQVAVIETTIIERRAEVTVEYELGSMFGDSFTVRNVIPLNVDEETNTWKIDFTGETDAQDLAAARASRQ